MNYTKSIAAVLAAATLAAGASRADAADRQRDRHGPSAGQAVPRGSVAPRTPSRPIVVVAPRVDRVAPYRPYHYPHRPGFSVGIYAGFPYGYSRYGYYPYAYSGYGYGPYGYGYPQPPAGYVRGVYGVAYGGVRIQGAPPDAQVFADGYYVGVVDDFDGAFQQMNLQPGPHQIEIRVPGYPPIEFDVRIEPGETITYHAQ